MTAKHLRLVAFAALTGLSALVACQSTGDECCPDCGAATQLEVSAPLDLDGKAWDRAMSLELPPVDPFEGPGLHNLFHLSENIVSGSEPHGDEALVALAEMGIKTVVSVDGKAPDAEKAAELGMRYVHVPIQYSDISDDELLRLSKTFRELEGPFYVHCFHGKHRGPAGAMVGRLVLDGIEREEAIAEMRQYCGTSKKYEGLYRLIAAGDVPTAAQTEAYEYDIAELEKVEGVVGSMVILSRAFDNNALLMESGWKVDPAHPDLDPRNEATQLVQGFELGENLSEVRTAADDYRSWWDEGLAESRLLLEAIEAVAAGDEGAAARADRHFTAVKDACSDCHGEYRNL